MGIRTEERETDKDNARTECSKASPQNNTHSILIVDIICFTGL